MQSYKLKPITLPQRDILKVNVGKCRENSCNPIDLNISHYHKYQLSQPPSKYSNA